MDPGRFILLMIKPGFLAPRPHSWTGEAQRACRRRQATGRGWTHSRAESVYLRSAAAPDSLGEEYCRLPDTAPDVLYKLQGCVETRLGKTRPMQGRAA